MSTDITQLQVRRQTIGEGEIRDRHRSLKHSRISVPEAKIYRQNNWFRFSVPRLRGSRSCIQQDSRRAVLLSVDANWMLYIFVLYGLHTADQIWDGSTPTLKDLVALLLCVYDRRRRRRIALRRRWIQRDRDKGEKDKI